MTLVNGDFTEAEFRVEGRAKVTGAARYAADLTAPGMLWAAYARSPIPHGRVIAIDNSEARAMVGVRAILTGADVRPIRFGRRLLDWPILAWDRVRFIGDRVAAVAADTRDGAVEAAARIRVTYDEYPAVFDPHTALEPDAPVLHEPEEAAEYTFIGGERDRHPHSNIQGARRIRRGEPDIETAFNRAVRVFEHSFTAPRQHQGHLEPHATLVTTEGDVSRVASTNKTPFLLRRQMAASLGLPPEEIVVETPYIGGDFGGKGLSLDELVCLALSRRTGRPVKAVMTFTDELQAANPRHGATIHLRTGVDADGRFVAHKSRIEFDGGAYAAGKASEALIAPGGLLTLAPYRVPNVDLEVVTVYTNNVPGGHMRAPGEAQAVFASESHVDMIATDLGLDPLELRRRNVVRAGDTGANGAVYRTARAVEVLDQLAEASDWARALPPGTGRGIGLSVRRPGGGRTRIVMRLVPGGRIEVATGAPEQGGGTHTVISRVTAASLSVSADRVRVVVGGTDTAPVDAGIGASRGTYLTSRAVAAAAATFKPALLDLAAARLGVDIATVSLVDDQFEVARPGAAPERLDFATVTGDASLADVSGEFDSRAQQDEEAAASFVGYVAEVAVDRETGALDIRQVTLAVDVGTIINPVAHRGQLQGGFVYGLGCSVMEELQIEEGRVTTVGLNDYKLPTSPDAPPLRIVLLPPEQGSGAFGAKMVGELSSSGVGPAIANAVAAACGARVDRFPITSERVYRALEASAADGAPAGRP